MPFMWFEPMLFTANPASYPDISPAMGNTNLAITSSLEELLANKNMSLATDASNVISCPLTTPKEIISLLVS